MFKFFLLIFVVGFKLTAFGADANKVPQSFEDIAADLKAKKAQLDPFSKQKVKIDVESLGLDDVDGKHKIIDNSAQKEEIKIPDLQKNEATPAVVENTEVKKDVDIKQEDLQVIGKTSSNKSAKINRDVKKETSVNQAPKVVDKLAAQSDLSKNKEDAKKLAKANRANNLKRRLALENSKKSQTKNEKIQSQKSQALNELRKKYLSIFLKEKESFDEISSFSDEEKVVPKRKTISRFVLEEPQPAPILNRFRSSQNVHIPTIPTKQEKIDLLFAAAANEDISFFNDAYQDVMDPNVENGQGDTILIFAILMQKHAVIESLLAKGADPNMPNKLGYTPLNIAIELLDSKSFEILFNNKADIKYVDGLGKTYLMQSARVGFLPAVELLIDNGLDVNEMDNEGFTALSIAYRYKKEVIVKYLLRHNAQTWMEKPYNPQDQSIMRELEEKWN